MSCGVGCRLSLDLELLCRPAAVAPIQPFTWELPYAAGVALKRKKKGGGKKRNYLLSIIYQNKKLKILNMKNFKIKSSKTSPPRDNRYYYFAIHPSRGKYKRTIYFTKIAHCLVTSFLGIYHFPMLTDTQ